MNIEIPNKNLAGDDIKYLFEHKDVQKRGNGYFREAIRYFHEPFDIHQENIENGELHKMLQNFTFSIFRNSSKECIHRIVEQNFEEWVERFERSVFPTNLVDEIRLVIVRFFYIFIFDNDPSEDKILIYLKSATNFHKTLKGEEVRSLSKRLRMYKDIKQQLEAPIHLRWLNNKKNLNCREREIIAKHIGGVFFHTGVVQVTELITHTLVEIHKNQKIKDNILSFIECNSFPFLINELEKYAYLDYVINESLRLFPEFGKTHREVTRRITIKDITLEKNSGVYLNFKESHQLYWDDPLVFKPERWDDSTPQATPKEIRNSHFIPFGVGQRRCPAEAFVRNTTKVAIVTMMKYVDLTIPKNFVHTRRLVRGVPTVLALKTYGQALRPGFQLNTVSVQDVVVHLEKNQRPVDQIDELAGLTFLGSLLKIASNFKYYKALGLVIFFPLITGVHIWLNFQIKQIQRYFIGRKSLKTLGN